MFRSFILDRFTPFINKPESSRDLTIFITFSISSFDIISVVVPDPKIVLCIPASAANSAAVNPNGIKTLLANSLITFFVNDILFLIMNQEVYQEILLIVLS